MIPAGLAFLAFFVLSVGFRLPVGVSLGLVGFVGLGMLRGWDAAAFSVGSEIFESTGYTVSVIPLFVLMGNFVTQGGLSQMLYRAAFAFVGHRRGGLATATIGACAGFGAVCGSSVATVATMANIAVPEMRRLGYSDGLATASVAAGGTLGLIIPPSALMVLYGIMTETSIGALFAAGFVPGILAMLLYMGAAQWTVWRTPSSGPPGQRIPWRDRWPALLALWQVLLLFVLVIGGLYSGVFTAIEAAGVGAAGGFLVAWFRGTLTLKVLGNILADSATTAAMVFVVIIGAMVFANFVTFTGLPDTLRDFVQQLGVSPIWVVVAICTVYILLGTAMEEISMVLLTLPVFFPLVTGLGLDPVWFGILIVCVVGIGLISPPVGLNVFVLRARIPDVAVSVIWRGLYPFIVADMVRISLLIALPVLSLWLPRELGLLRAAT